MSLAEEIKDYFFVVLRRIKAQLLIKIGLGIGIRIMTMSGIAMMYFQSESVLHFQRQLEAKAKKSNLSTMFDVDKVPSDTQMRDIMDSDELRPAPT